MSDRAPDPIESYRQPNIFLRIAQVPYHFCSDNPASLNAFLKSRVSQVVWFPERNVAWPGAPTRIVMRLVAPIPSCVLCGVCVVVRGT